MIKVRIRETGVIETLSMPTDGGTDPTADIIGANGGFTDGDFTLVDADFGVYEADLATYEWWAKYLAELAELEERLAELREEHGHDAVADAVLAAGNMQDLADHIANLNRELDETFGA